MEKNKVMVENPVTVDGVTLVPITRVLSHHWCRKHSFSYFDIKQPVGVVVISPSGKKAFRITGEEISLGQLITEFPGIKEVVEGI
jgi:hypothetical protein